ncbi:MAG: hypothetical protein QME50_07245 [Candidatus Bathyarchaeota archaeon]|nr:hypothetical protein [Candidatus Bathyarchaeota archaeon]
MFAFSRQAKTNSHVAIILPTYCEAENIADIILKVTYPTANPTHPTVSIVERLGTISEKSCHDS